MNRTWKDEAVTRLFIKMNKHRFFKWRYRLLIYLVTFIYAISHYFVSNYKRFGCVLASFLFFMVTSSFSFLTEEPVVINELADNEEWTSIQENYEYQLTDLNTEIEKALDDDDVIDGYDNSELEVSEDQIDKFSLDDILDANEYTQGEYEEEKQELSVDDWQLILVNKQHPIPEDYEYNLGTIKGSMKCDARIIGDLMAMMAAAKEDGVNLVICSPYRDYNRQTVLFNRKIDYYMEKGYSYMEAYKISSITVTVPGASEHQLGLSLDIVSDVYSSLDIEFGDTEAGQWLKEHCAEYGFIVRYPLGKEYITGIQYEPWHFRYVGKTAATIIMNEGITLEELVEELD